jgi:ribosome-associated protein
MAGIQINDLLEIPESQLRWSFSRSGGPGGQNVNKVNSKATLRWLPADDMLSPAAWNRFIRKARRYLTADGEIVIQSQLYRDQAKNIEDCREKLREMLVISLIAPKKRVATKPSKAARQRRLTEKRLTSAKKDSRRQGRSGATD